MFFASAQCVAELHVRGVPAYGQALHRSAVRSFAETLGTVRANRASSVECSPVAAIS